MRGSEKETPFPLPKSGKKMALGFEPRQLDSRVYPLATTPASPTPLELGICSVLWTWEQVLGKHPKFLAYNFHLLHPLCSSTQQQDWGGSSCHRGEGQGAGHAKGPSVCSKDTPNGDLQGPLSHMHHQQCILMRAGKGCIR